jgi:hypothetical protein
MLSVALKHNMLTVVILTVFVLIYRYIGCHYADCRGANVVHFLCH